MGALGLNVDDFLKPGRVIQIGYEPLRIDLINEIDGVSFDEAWENKIESDYGRQSIFVIGKVDLIKTKKHRDGNRICLMQGILKNSNMSKC